MDKLYRKLFRRSAGQSQTELATTREDSAVVTDRSKPRDEAADGHEMLEQEDAGLRKESNGGKKSAIKMPHKSKLGKQPSRPLDPYLPPYVAADRSSRRRLSPSRLRCVCGCGCDEAACDKSDRWRPDLKKFSKCSGIVASVLSAAAVSDTDSDEERSAGDLQHRRDKQWYNFQLNNGTESVGYRLSPR